MTPDSIWFAVRARQAAVSKTAIERGFPNLSTVEPGPDALRSAAQLRAWQLATRPDLAPTPTQEVAA
ncbi:hypothetical protein [Verrucosispora sp. NA02020]|uniref:hypothetical protein n=1 Tax=Verrucosispora sp. NA02020 TaxID=2742132 RepID=UPI0015900770|nr:hypothetical protein [Verrucosispora sp. NA02020]QKW15335.1 hypothetical protein HUT12_22950 [Verrucosispora sp. NA02020]